VIWLQDVLGTSVANAYKKINGEVALTHNEIAAICEQIPEAAYYLPDLLNLPNMFLGRLNGFMDGASIGAFLSATNHNLSRLQKATHQLNYMARDISFFWFLAKPKLFAFKMALWTNNLHKEGINFKEAAAYYPRAQALYKTYLGLSSLEIWYQHAMINLVEQMRAAFVAGNIRHDDFSDIQNELLQLCADFAGFATHRKKKEGTFKMLSTPFSTMHNGGLFLSQQHKYLMAATVDARHFTTQNENLIAYFEQAFEGQMGFARDLSLEERNLEFFNALKTVLLSADELKGR
jgi:hypothetical protein